MKAYYNGITLEGTLEEVAQCMKAIQAQDKPVQYPYIPNRTQDAWWFNQQPNVTCGDTTNSNSIEQQNAYGKVYKTYGPVWPEPSYRVL